MEAVNSWCRLISAVSVISSVFILFIPESRVKNAYKTLLAFILVFSFLYPLIDGEDSIVNISDNIVSFSDNSDPGIGDYDNLAVITAAESEFERYAEDKTVDLGIDCEFDVLCDYESNKITIERIEINGKINETDLISIIKIIGEISDNESEIIVNGEKI